MNWVNSTGGPLVLIERNKVSRWFGSKNDALSESHYYLACQVDDLIARLQFRFGDVIVLGDEPLQTSILEGSEQETAVVVRWRYAPSESVLATHLAKVFDLEYPKGECSFTITHGDLILFDAASAGEELSHKESIEVKLTQGEYSISTLEYMPERDVAILLHRFQRVGSVD